MTPTIINLDTRKSFHHAKLVDTFGGGDAALSVRQGQTVVLPMCGVIPESAVVRLLHMIRVLEGSLPGKFDLGVFISHVVGSAIRTCGTAACACGWAYLDPWFERHAPPEVMLTEHRFSSFSRWVLGDGGDRAPVSYLIKVTRTCEVLFLSSAYPALGRTSPQRVADRIRVILNAAGYTGKYMIDNTQRAVYAA